MSSPYGTPVPGAIDIKDPYPRPMSLGEKEAKVDFHPWAFDPRVVPLWDKEIEAVNTLLSDENITATSVDEIALLFPHEMAATMWIMSAVLDEDVHHFNAAYDEVKTSPIESLYSVRYDFLSLARRSYRVEAMQLTHGVSPLHAALLEGNRLHEMPVPVHFSFKTWSEQEYILVCGRMADHDFEQAQECESTYGKFSYWKHPDADLYIKPRLNKRDAK